MKSDIFKHIDKDNLNFTYVKTAGEGFKMGNILQELFRIAEEEDVDS